MTEQVLASLFISVGAVVAAAIAAVGVILGLLWRRIAHLEERLRKRESYNRRLWIWARDLFDMYFKYRREGAPAPRDPPEDEDDDARE